ncbi:hypothetical protein WA026_022916 [Henosepilachna vigintioctopunctata]|uniref:Uncharacterized protein n=1 Tax=Henosepilachna vigintioctopunctata TaxID=420089 RepID=A0AAW1TYR6_9CUCU
MTWTTPEKNIVRSTFRDNFNDNTIPSLSQIEEVMNSTRLRSINRTSQQVRKWIEHQLKLKQSAKISWGTPQRKKCRRVFKDYYERKRMNIYPSVGEIQAAIHEHPEFRGKTVNQIRSHIQHDIKYLRRPERPVLDFN